MPEWVWDAVKDALNRKLHDGLSLEAGVVVLEDDFFAISRPDPHPDDDRWQVIGSPGGTRVLFVAHSEPVEQAGGTELGRIISVQKATPSERRQYEQDRGWRGRTTTFR